MELSTLRQKYFAALMPKALWGELFMTVAVGDVWASNDRVEMDQDGRIRKAIELICRRFRQFSSVRLVLVWLRQQRIEPPAVFYGKVGRTVVWELPIYNSLSHIVTNPIYAGADV